MPIIEGLLLNPTPQGVSYVARYVGEPNIPGSVKRRRRWVFDALRRVGTPVLVKHRYNDQDVVNGDATRSPAFDDIYGHTYSYDAISHGVGYCSIETSPTEWFHTVDGTVITSEVNPGSNYLPAPKYRGYGPGFIIFIIEPDAALDFFRLTPTGALIKTQSAQAVAPWYPNLNDNDLLINIELDPAGNIVATQERYELKMANPTSVRGSEKRGRREGPDLADGGNRYVLQQAFEMALIPEINHPIYNVEVDR